MIRGLQIEDKDYSVSCPMPLTTLHPNALMPFRPCTLAPLYPYAFMPLRLYALAPLYPCTFIPLHLYTFFTIFAPSFYNNFRIKWINVFQNTNH